MLRRSEKIVLKPDPPAEAQPADVFDPLDPALPAADQPVRAMRADLERAFGSPGGPSLRKSVEVGLPPAPTSGVPIAEAIPATPDAARIPEADRTFGPPKVERRQGDRRAMDKLRAEALRNVISRVEDKNFNGLRNAKPYSSRKGPPKQLILVAVALVAGGMAAYLALQENTAAPAPAPAVASVTEMVPEARMQVLVAKTTIGIGQRLSENSIQWADWPEGEVRPEYVTVAAMPDALTEMAGDIARVEIFAGEPIRPEKLAGKEGLLSAVLEPGMRGVSVAVMAEAASGGYIIPNDRVDVLLTRATTVGQVSETILSNVRVLAINARMMGSSGAEAPVSDDAAAQAKGGEVDVFTNQAIATLELDPVQAEMIVNSLGVGKLALVLRSTTDIAQAADSQSDTINRAIRVTSPFWAK